MKWRQHFVTFILFYSVSISKVDNNNDILFSLNLQVIIYNIKIVISMSAGTPDVVNSNLIWSPIYITLELFLRSKERSRKMEVSL